MGTVSYGFESMDEVAHQLHVLQTKVGFFCRLDLQLTRHLDGRYKTNVVNDRCPACDSWATGYVVKGEGRHFVSCTMSQCGYRVDPLDVCR